MKSSLSTRKKKSSPGSDARKRSRYSYVYCIVPAGNSHVDQLQIEGVEGQRVSAIREADFTAVVSDSSDRKHEILDAGILHQRVVEAVHETGPVLPFGFGHIATERELRTFIRRRHAQIQMLFNRYGNKKQLALKAYWNMDAVLKEIYLSDENVRVLKKQTESKPEVVAHRLKMELGERVARDLESLGSRLESTIFRPLDQIAEKSRKNKNLNKEMFLNAVFLVDESKESLFDEAVNSLEEQCGESIHMKYVVSVPYDFISLKI